MIKLTQLLEEISLYSCEVLIKTSKEANKVEVYNKLRAIKGVVVITIRHSDFLDSKATKKHEWSLLYIKFISPFKPHEVIKNIGIQSLEGEFKVEGLITFVPRYRSIKRVQSTH